MHVFLYTSSPDTQYIHRQHSNLINLSSLHRRKTA